MPMSDEVRSHDVIARNVRISGKYCSVPGCGGKSGSMFVFPKETAMRLRWREACKVQREKVTDSMLVCYLHFDGKDIAVTGKFQVVSICSGATSTKNLDTPFQ